MPSNKLSNDRESLWPALSKADYRITSPETTDYNCAAWAGNDTGRKWWPIQNNAYYWPAARKDDSRQAFIEGYRTQNYEECDSPAIEDGYEKIAVYFNTQGPQHVARQLPGGRWTSKLGEFEDIEHPNLSDVTSGDYGQPELIMRKKID